MGWIDRFHSHRLAANLLMVMMLALGLFAARQVPTALDPSATIPGVWVEVQWPGAAAEDVAEAVATPLEQALLGVPGLDEIHARSRPGQAVLSLEFFPDTDMVLALDTVKQRVASLRELPRDAERPTVSRITDDELIASLLVTGGDRLEDLIPLARRLEAELLEAGIDQVVMNGLPEQALNIEVPSTFLTGQGLSLERLALNLTEQAREQ
ncbi:MAG: efflux RND transporter permease subunit, partial [Proteobacteria bacterium]|nr:efflux RND transporter permease subunit [Pseudomonadota bacterium]